MNQSNLKQEDHLNQLLSDWILSEQGSTRFNQSLQLSNLEKGLLQISSFEKAEFIVDQKNIKLLREPRVDRLSMVNPPSYAFSIHLKIVGYFKVKYKAAQNSLPVQIEPFKVGFTGIIIPNEMGFDIKNETVKILK